MNAVDAHVGRVLLHRRMALTLSSAEVAAACRLEVSALVEMERGNLRVSAAQLFALLRFYGLTPADLLNMQVETLPDGVH
jgi:transcriptional regulator with XRE-family HTH domain